MAFGERHGRIATLSLVDSSQHTAQLRIAIQYELNRRAVARHDLLFDMGDFQGRRPIDVAVIGAKLAANRREQARLAGAVGAGDSDLVAAVDGEVDLLEQRLRTAPQGEIPSR